MCPKVLDSVTCSVWSIDTLFVNSSANRGCPGQLVTFSIFLLKQRQSQISQTEDEKQLEDIPVEQGLCPWISLSGSMSSFSLGQFLHFTNTASVSSPTFEDRSGFWLCFVLFFSSFMDLGKRNYMAAIRSMDVAKLKEDLPETHGGLCVAEYKMLWKRHNFHSDYFSVPSMG